jgi:hypothetical protein
MYGLPLADRDRGGNVGLVTSLGNIDDRGGLDLCGLADVAVVQAADLGKLHDLPGPGELDWPEIGASLSSARWVRA